MQTKWSLVLLGKTSKLEIFKKKDDLHPVKLISTGFVSYCHLEYLKQPFFQKKKKPVVRSQKIQ